MVSLILTEYMQNIKPFRASGLTYVKGLKN